MYCLICEIKYYRYSWYRTEKDTLRRLAQSPRSNYLLLNRLDPLFGSNKGLYFAKYDQVKSIVDKVVPEREITKAEQDILLVFLGIDEKEGISEQGHIYWALDVTPTGTYKQELESLVEGTLYIEEYLLI